MPKKQTKKSQNSEVKRTMLEGELKQVATEDLLINQKKNDTNESTEGFLDNGRAEESEEPQGELNDADYTSAGEGGDEEETDEDDEESVEQEETTSFVCHFHEDDDEEKGKRIGCAFENLYVHGEGRTYCALVGPTPRTGKRSWAPSRFLSRAIQTPMGSRSSSNSRAPVASR